MKKILAVIDALNYEEVELNGIELISRLSPCDLTIVMMEDLTNANQMMAPGMPGDPSGSYYEMMKKLKDDQHQLIHQNTGILKQACKDRNMHCTIINIAGNAVTELITLSRFSDLLVIGKTLSFPFLFDSNPTGFVKNMLAHAQCPVLIIPENIFSLKGVTCCYYGTYAAMYAIKTFTALFPLLVADDCKVVYVREKGQHNIPHGDLLQEYLKLLNPNVEYSIISGTPDKALEEYLGLDTDHVAVFGAYGRSRLSRFFNSSSADNILRHLVCPVFITHPAL